jgi:hypothetical protein
MLHYEYMHVPGIDHLGLQIWGFLLTAKQVSSVAEQLERKNENISLPIIFGERQRIEEAFKGEWQFTIVEMVKQDGV